MNLEQKLAQKDKELKEKIKRGEVKVCNVKNPEDCLGCGS